VFVLATLACVQVVIKPAELTPLTAVALAELAERAGLPDGVLNVSVHVCRTSNLALAKALAGLAECAGWFGAVRTSCRRARV